MNAAGYDQSPPVVAGGHGVAKEAPGIGAF
jgi:hypothetical protein